MRRIPNRTSHLAGAARRTGCTRGSAARRIRGRTWHPVGSRAGTADTAWVLFVSQIDHGGVKHRGLRAPVGRLGVASRSRRTMPRLRFDVGILGCRGSSPGGFRHYIASIQKSDKLGGLIRLRLGHLDCGKPHGSRVCAGCGGAVFTDWVRMATPAPKCATLVPILRGSGQGSGGLVR